MNCVPGTTRTRAKKLLSLKMVYVDQVITTQFDTPLKPGQLVQIAQKGSKQDLRNKYVNIIYEDAFILVVNKESGIVSVPMPGTKENSVKNILNDYVKRKNKTASVHTVHRLDRGTSGIMMFAKSRDVQKIIIDYWHQIITERKYVALVDGYLENNKGTVTSWLSDDKKYVIFSSPVNNGGKYAVTNYTTLKRNNGLSLVELQLQTGRTNQIRVHMKDLKHPVLGDEKYGEKTDKVNRLCLHAKNLCFYHPITKQLMKFNSDLPELFNKLIK
jgi:23S rRNA pseudouridine1911/1915/1917 synthase